MNISALRFLTCLFTFFLFYSGSVLAEGQVARLAFHWGASHHSAQYAQMFADEVNLRAEGELRIDVYPASKMFGIRDIMAGVAAGVVEIGSVVGIVSFPPINKNYTIAARPWLFESFEDQRTYLSRSEEGMALWADLEEKTGSVRLMYNPVGPIMIFSSARPLDSIAAVEGLKVRSLFNNESPIWTALGAEVVPVPSNKIYQALETGHIDTLNAPPGSLEAYDWWAFLKYGQRPYQSFADGYLMANVSWFNSLSPELQKILRDVGVEIGKRATVSIMELSENTLQKFVLRGGSLVSIRGAARAELDDFMKLQMSSEEVPAVKEAVTFTKE